MAKATAHPVASVVLTAVYLAQCALSVVVLRGVRIRGYGALSLFPAAMVAVLCVLHITRAAGSMCARALGANRTNSRKFGDQSWQLFIHVTMTLFEVAVLSGETWYDDPGQTVSIPAARAPRGFLGIGGGGPLEHLAAAPLDPVKWSADALYLVQLAIWVVTCFSHHFLEARHKDYVLMYMHHVVTIALVLLSWTYQHQRIGVAVLYIHDVSDIATDLLKMANYLKLEGPRNAFCLEAIFVFNLGGWFWWRIFKFGVVLVPACVVQGIYRPWHRACGQAFFGDLCMGRLLNTLLLSALCCMHAWWVYLLMRIAYKLVLAPGKGHDAGREEYEGDSEEEDSEEEGPSPGRIAGARPKQH